MSASLVYLLLRQVLQTLTQLARDDGAKDVAAEHDRYLDQMDVVDEPGGEEVAYDGGAAADPDVLAIGCFAGGLERLGRGRRRGSGTWCRPPSRSRVASGA